MTPSAGPDTSILRIVLTPADKVTHEQSAHLLCCHAASATVAIVAIPSFIDARPCGRQSRERRPQHVRNIRADLPRRRWSRRCRSSWSGSHRAPRCRPSPTRGPRRCPWSRCMRLLCRHHGKRVYISVIGQLSLCRSRQRWHTKTMCPAENTFGTCHHIRRHRSDDRWVIQQGRAGAQGKNLRCATTQGAQLDQAHGWARWGGSRRTWRGKVSGFWPTDCGLPMLQSTTSGNGRDWPSFSACMCPCHGCDTRHVSLVSQRTHQFTAGS
jgi:hypothetical protein